MAETIKCRISIVSAPLTIKGDTGVAALCGDLEVISNNLSPKKLTKLTKEIAEAIWKATGGGFGGMGGDGIEVYAHNRRHTLSIRPSWPWNSSE